jgi:hypothetical protein
MIKHASPYVLSLGRYLSGVALGEGQVELWLTMDGFAGMTLEEFLAGVG